MEDDQCHIDSGGIVDQSAQIGFGVISQDMVLVFIQGFINLIAALQ